MIFSIFKMRFSAGGANPYRRIWRLFVLWKYKYLSAVKEKIFAWGNEAAPVYNRETFPVYATTSASYFFYGDVVSLDCWNTVYRKVFFSPRRVPCSRRVRQHSLQDPAVSLETTRNQQGCFCDWQAESKLCCAVIKKDALWEALFAVQTFCLGLA